MKLARFSVPPMTTTVTTPPKPAVVYYPDDDGLPMADNTWQFNCILLLQSNLDVQYRNDPKVFVAGNHLIYAVENDNKTRQAPDVYVAFGRPKHERGSYRVWEEGGTFPQVIFEVWSPHNRHQAMEDKRDFYEKYGAEEYYIVYPEFPAHVEGWRRDGEKLVRIPDMNGWISPRLGIRFVLDTGELTVFGADGRPFRSAAQLAAERDAATAERDAASAERDAAAAERDAATAERDAAAAERDAARQRAERLAARLRELGADPDGV
jgi:Uma2 family endonuclease